MPPRRRYFAGRAGYNGVVGEAKVSRAPAEVVCPHCKKSFEPELLDGSATPFAGSKCPHCRLFVPSDRAEQADAA
jgi:hypothetical protein